ncbi:MAG: MarR family transcriptional regulator [Desulfobacteraceae bacterium]|nr:MarR family transcriptional regulator [Desulfobacteraceae bacterium]
MKTDHIIALIGNIRAKAHNFIIEELNKRGLSGLVPSHGAILNLLFKEDCISMREAARRIERSKSTVTVLVNKLVDAGYIDKRQSPNDRRITLIGLTRKGRDLETDFNAISRLVLDRTYKSLSEHEKASVVRGLEKIRNNW